MNHARFVLVNVPADEWHGEVRQERSVIGRSMKAEIALPARYTKVSRSHAEVVVDKARYWLRDLDSRSGTHVNGVVLHGPRPVELRFGDRITLADTELQFVSVLQADDARNIRQLEVRRDETRREDSPSTVDLYLSSSQLAVKTDSSRLTGAELEIVLWMHRGVTENAEIGRVLHRSPNTVRTQVGGILRKFKLTSRIAILRFFSCRSDPSQEAPPPDSSPTTDARFSAKIKT